MKKFFFKIKGRQYDVEVKQFEDGVAKVDVNGTIYEMEVETPKKAVSKTPTFTRSGGSSKANKPAAKPAAAGAKIKAPLPGSIFKINVSVGDEVKEGQTVMIMEAMKMENNIQSESSGTVKAIKVNVGDAVMQDDVLIELG